LKSELQKFLSEKKGKLLPLLIIPIAVLLIVFGGGGESDDNVTPEDELAAVCSEMEGVGECRVMVTYKDGEVFAVAVICEGAESPKTRQKIVELVTSVYGIGSNRVTVQKLGGTKK
jgi:hypothetical protein